MEQWILKGNLQQDWISFIFLFNFILLALLKSTHSVQFQYFIRVIDSSVYFKLYGKNNLRLQYFTLLGFIFLYINLSLFVFFILNPFSIGAYSFSSFIDLSSKILCIITLRFIFLRLCFRFLKFSSFSELFQFKNLTYQIQISILLFILLLLYQYQFYSLRFLNFSLIVTLILYFVSQLLVLKEYWNTFKNNLLYLILYLCTFKLAPWMILYGIIK